MMTDAERAFLAAIRAAPDDNIPRLAYADWLDETGEAERAAFIRMQWGSIPRDEAELARLQPIVERWAETLMPAGWTVNLDRGLPFSLSCPGEEFLVHGPDVMAAFPITDLGVGTRSSIIEQIMAMPCMSLVESVSERDDRWLEQLRVHNFDYETPPSRLLHGIAASAYFHSLRSVRTSAKIEVGGIEAFGESPWAGLIEDFKVSNYPGSGDHAITAMARGVTSERFRCLVLHQCGIIDAGVAAWAASPRTAGTEHLQLTDNMIGDACVAALAASEHARALRGLGLSGNRYGNAGFAALARSEHLTDIDSLDIGSTADDVSDGLTALADEARMRPTFLLLDIAHADADSWRRLSRSPFLDRLEGMYLLYRPSALAAVRAVVTSPRLNRLSDLRVRPHPDLLSADGDAVARVVAEDFALPAIRKLSFTVPMGEVGVELLLASPRLPPRLSLTVALTREAQLPQTTRTAFCERFGPKALGW